LNRQDAVVELEREADRLADFLIDLGRRGHGRSA
jgi:hypothetical protein